jgi:hypothetical protein
LPGQAHASAVSVIHDRAAFVDPPLFGLPFLSSSPNKTTSVVLLHWRCRTREKQKQICDYITTIDLLSLGKAPFYGSEGSEFESRRVQMLEQQAIASPMLSEEGRLDATVS